MNTYEITYTEDIYGFQRCRYKVEAENIEKAKEVFWENKDCLGGEVIDMIIKGARDKEIEKVKLIEGVETEKGRK